MFLSFIIISGLLNTFANDFRLLSNKLPIKNLNQILLFLNDSANQINLSDYLSWIATTLTTEEGRSIPIESIGCV